ncbi:hypothetical protein ACKKBF_B02730 [Auxenochlorella protothecoides x Auxenochlorella symbiontica]
MSKRAAWWLACLLVAGYWQQALGAAQPHQPFLHATRRSAPHRHVPVHEGCAVIANGPDAIVFSATECKGAVAHASFQRGKHTRHGWSQFSVHTFNTTDDLTQLRAAGFLEGYFTAREIQAHYNNVVSTFNTSQAQRDWLLEQHAWSRSQATEQGPSSPAWRAVGLTLAQLEGMVLGYAARRRAEGDALRDLGLVAFLETSSVGDLGDIRRAIAVRQSLRTATAQGDLLAPWAGMGPQEVVRELTQGGRCSALVSVTPDLSDLLLGHSAWFTFGGMVRVYKHYRCALSDPDLPGTALSFSSYPGELSSDDDFYLTSTGLVVLQTTNRVLNESLFHDVHAHSLPSWQRERVACWTARDGPAWAAAVAAHNSGTGNNQWMVADLGRFAPGADLTPGLLTIVEQIPGRVAVWDGTPHLERGYWPSYNIPADPGVYAASGYAAAAAALAARGPAWAAAAAALSYHRAPRAAIFRRDASGVRDLATLRALLRANRWPHDPLGGGSALGAICGRGDAGAGHPAAYGCIDTKVTRWAAALRREAQAVNGPTATPALPPFDWGRVNASLARATPHEGQPRRFEYEFAWMTPDATRWER